MRLTPHFTLSEMVRTSTGLPNAPSEEVIRRLETTAGYLEAIRAIWGPLVVVSGYRSPAVNAAVGGVSTSGHLTGYAVDIRPTRGTAYDVWEWLPTSGLPFDQAILSVNKTTVHISFDPRARGEHFTK